MMKDGVFIKINNINNKKIYFKWLLFTYYYLTIVIIYSTSPYILYLFVVVIIVELIWLVKKAKGNKKKTRESRNLSILYQQLSFRNNIILKIIKIKKEWNDLKYFLFISI